MATRDGTLLQVRIDGPLKRAFTEAARREQTTTADLLRRLMRGFVQDSRRKEAERQSALVAAAPDASESMDIVTHVQDFARD